jgi:hypothetical protein
MRSNVGVGNFAGRGDGRRLYRQPSPLGDRIDAVAGEPALGDCLIACFGE